MDVFISYSRKDYQDENKKIIPNSAVQKIKEKLDKNSITYWFDEDSIYVGDQFVNLIAKSIKEAPVFLFVSSKNSNASPWTLNEVATAYHYKKKIIPVRIDDTDYDESIVMFLAALDHMDYFSNPELELNRMTTSIKTYLEDEVNSRKKQEAEKARIQRLKVVDEMMSQEYTNKLSIENDIVAQKEILSNLEAKLIEVEASIMQLQGEKEKLNGSNKEPKDAKPAKNDNTDRWSFLKRVKLPHVTDYLGSVKGSSVKMLCIVCALCLLGILGVNQCSEMNRMRTENTKLAMLQDSIAREDSIKHQQYIQDSIMHAQEKEDSIAFQNDNTVFKVTKYEFVSEDHIRLHLVSSVKLKNVSKVSGEAIFPNCTTLHELESTDISSDGFDIVCDLKVDGHRGDYSSVELKRLFLCCSYGTKRRGGLGTFYNRGN